MRQAGCESIAQIEQLSLMGFSAVVRALPRLWWLRHQTLQYLSAVKPEVFIGVDFTDFNLWLARQLRPLGVHTIQYKGPSVWAWRANRMKQVQASCDQILTLFPFEQAFYNQYSSSQAHYIGHFLADNIPMQTDRNAARATLGIEPNKTLIALMPGSRWQELRYLAKPFLQTAQYCQAKRPHWGWAVSLVNQEQRAWFEAMQQKLAPELNLDLFVQQSHLVLQSCNAALLCSGTITLEALLFKKPMIVAYQFPKYYQWLLKRLVHVDHIALPNLLAGKRLVPECLQTQVCPQTMGALLLSLVEQPDPALLEHFQLIHQQLRKGANQLAASYVLPWLGQSPC